MIDEMWMRGWNDNHSRFSADIDRGIATLAGAISRLRRRRNERIASQRHRTGVPR